MKSTKYDEAIFMIKELKSFAKKNAPELVEKIYKIGVEITNRSAKNVMVNKKKEKITNLFKQIR